MTPEDLRHACHARGLNGDGTKAQLVRKLTVGSSEYFVLSCFALDGMLPKICFFTANGVPKLGDVAVLFVSRQYCVVFFKRGTNAR